MCNVYVNYVNKPLTCLYLSIGLCQTAPEHCPVSVEFLRETEVGDIKKATSVSVCVVGAPSAVRSVPCMCNSSEIRKT